MKKLIVVIGIIAAIGLVVWGAWFFIFSSSSQHNVFSNQGTPTPTVPSTPQPQSPTQSVTPARVQQISSPEDPLVAKDFLSQIPNANLITLGGTVVDSPYALQIWGDPDTGAEALLEYASSTGWTLVTLGGGEWNVFALMQQGVPLAYATQLVAGLTSSTSTPPPAPPTNIPTGGTLTIGTPRGSVTMDNFYKSAEYVDQYGQGVIVQQTSTYVIVYNIWNSSFTITIFSTPIAAARAQAEAAFLQILGISQTDACKLTVEVGVLDNIDPSQAGQNLGLSFCPASALGQ